MAPMFQVLVHPALSLALRQHARALRDRFRKTLHRLSAGLWNGGTRVKRLVGMARPLFEARVDAGNRILFTVVASADRGHPARLAPHLLVWDLVDHDGVKRAGRRNFAPEAEFLELPAVEEYDISEPPPCPEAEFAAVPEGAAEEGLLHFLLPPEGFQAPQAEAIDGAVRWFFLDTELLLEEQEFQRLMDRGGEELELKLTAEQYEILRARGPVLLAGSAGSGKTTIAVHRLAEAAGTGVPALYLSYSPWLKEHASRLYGDLLAARGLEAAGTAPRFLTFDELYRDLAPVELRGVRMVSAELFESWFRKSGSRLDPALVWEGIGRAHV